MLSLAKPGLDVGLYTDDIDAQRAFFEQRLGLPYEELLKVGGGVHQHRLGLRGSVLKLNASREPLPDAPTGYRRLRIAIVETTQAPDSRETTDSTAAQLSPLNDADGLDVELVADGLATIGIDLDVADPTAHDRFLVDALGADRVGDNEYRLGTTSVRTFRNAAVERAGPMRARGFRYLTVQVHDVASEHARLVGAGVEEAMAPRKLGDVAMISFIRDPGGNWIEISQRASLTGPLP